MKTKNIQDVVAEKVEEFANKLNKAIDTELAREKMRGKANIKDGGRVISEIVFVQWFQTTLTQLVKEVEAGEREELNEAIKILAQFADWGNKDHQMMARDYIIAKQNLNTSNYIVSLKEKIQLLLEEIQALTTSTSDEALQDNK